MAIPARLEPDPLGRRLELLAGAEARRWQRLALGRRTVGPGEIAWRQAVTLATVDELRELERALAGAPSRNEGP